MTITVTSPQFRDQTEIPQRFVKDGGDTSPPLAWDHLPEGTQELVLLCEDPDAPREKPFVHWLLYGIPPSTEGLEEGAAEIGFAGRNDFGDIGYGGPKPPEGDDPHHYHFHLFALDQPLRLEEGLSKEEVTAAMGRHVLDSGELIGVYQR